MSAANDLSTGSILQARYEVMAVLGTGGFGVVYKARQLATGQPVAIKVMRPLDDEAPLKRDKRVARFRREMEMCARLHHPNIVGLVDSGQLDDGRLFTVFEFVPGQTLESVIASEGPLHPREARHLMLQVLDALSCAHGQGVVHRDLKPANVMIISTGTRRNAQVLDFGVGALAEESQGAEYTKLTSAHEWLGTPHYTAPEQVRGYPPTTQSDLYAWGLVYLECLTGRPVMTGTSVADVLMAQLGPEAIALPPAIRHHPLGRVIQRATVKDVFDREATAATLLRQLEACDVNDLDRLEGGPAQPAVTSAMMNAPTVDSVVGEGEPATRELSPRSLQVAPPMTPASAGRGGRIVDAERRQITAVCCSLTPTGPAAATELDALDELIATLQDLASEVAQQYQGQLAGGLGHQVLIEFGYPTAREDDAARAALTALAIRSRVHQRVGLAVRVGIHTGLVAYGPREASRRISGQIVGHTPMIASQLNGRAELDTIAVSATSAQLLRSQFALTAIGKVTLDGVAREMEVFRLDGERLASAAPSSFDLALATPLVGRDREMELLLERWQQVRAGTGQSVLVTGEPGIGKSRLASELARRVGDRPHTWLEARCTPESRNRVLHPIVELMERLFELGDGLPGERLERLEARLIGFGFRPAEAVPLFASLLGLPLEGRYPALDLSPARLRQHIFNAVLGLLGELAERQPVVVFVEDLHWADPTTLELLGALVAAAPTGRILALLNARPEFVPPWPSSEMLQIQLARLARPQIEQIVAAVAGKALPTGVHAQLVERTDGVPLFIEELTRMVVESDGALADVAIPTTLRDSLMARLDRLGRAKETAQLASALGREFELALLTAISSLTPDEVQEDLDRLVAADLVHHRRRLRNPLWLFRHALIRDTAYDSMPRRVQHKVHARIAEALERDFPDLVTTRPDLLAHHHAHADQKLQAIAYGQKAALGALMTAEYPYAIRHARDAIGWLDAIPDERARAEAELGFNGIITPSLMSTRGWRDEELRAVIERSAELDQRLGDTPFTGTTLWALMLFHHMGGRESARAHGYAERMLAHAREHGDVSQAVMAEAALGHNRWIAGDYRAASAHWDRMLAAYDPAAHRGHAYLYGHDSRAWAGISYAEALWFMGQPERSLALAESSLAWAKELGHANTLAVAYIFFILLRHDRGERDAIEPLWKALLELSDRHGLPIHVAYAGVVRCWAVGDVEGAKQHLALLETTGTELGLSFYRACVAEAEAEQGQLDAAIARITALQAEAEAVGERYYLAEVLRLRGRFVAGRDGAALDEAEALFRQAIAIAREQGTRMCELRAALELGKLLLRRGARDQARDLLAPLVADFTEGQDTAPLVKARELLAALDT